VIHGQEMIASRTADLFIHSDAREVDDARR
jgi:hypothetical protein